ncbi:MAG: hypothetical protein HC822_17525 [Oscillochloris sp.]|nr:hypothetical protein [Oscillochloris sp.]
MIPRNLYLDQRSLGWLCGLLEGEGTFVPGPPSKPRRPCVALNMTDEDVVQRVCDLWGARLYHIKVKHAEHLPVFRTELVGGSAVALMQVLEPHMSVRRRRQIATAVASYRVLRVVKHKRFHISLDGAESFDRYWHAALLEGEGAFTHNRGSPMIELNTVDQDVIERVQWIWREHYGCAVNVHVRPPRRAGYQPQFHLACYGDAARLIMDDIVPLLGQRRRMRIDELRGDWRQGRLMNEQRARYAYRRAA